MTPTPFWFRTLLIRTGSVLLLLGITGYFLYQARHVILGPQIIITNSPAVVQHERTVVLTGHVSNITRLTLNGRQIFTDRDGYFETPLILETGYTIVTLQAQDRYGREVSVARSFVYVPASTVNTTL